MTAPIPDIAGKEPIAVELEAGKTYFWCACGKSATQPFCDGSHKGTAFEPLKFTAEKSGTAWLCACKRSGNKPYCNGTHKRL
jgi:CDGSH iron-sulfur domain-containing protein 3